MFHSNDQPIASNVGKSESRWMPVFIGINTALIVLLGFGLFSVQSQIRQMDSTNQAQIESVAEEIKHFQTNAETRTSDLESDLDVMAKRLGVTTNELNQARQLTQALKRQQEEAEKMLAEKANSTEVDSWRQEATSKMTEIQQSSEVKLGTVSGEVTGIRQDLASTKDEFGRQLVDVKNTLSDGIARNSAELSELRKKGERDYFEFEIVRSSKNPMQRVADVQLALTKTDAKKHKYSVAILADDNRLEKKDRTTNEPVQFLVGRDQLRYEIVVNTVAKDRIRGYLSAPKDKVLSAEAPTLRSQQ